MLITFKSKAAAEVIMYEEHAKPILDLFHKDIKRGVIAVAEMGAVIARLEADIAESRKNEVPEETQDDGDADNDREHASAQRVSFAARAYPLLEMLRAAQKENQPVAWGI